MLRKLPKPRHVLFVAFGASLVAYQAMYSFPDPLNFGPLGPFFIVFLLYSVASGGGWLMFIALFLPSWFAIASLLSAALLARSQRAWGVSAAIFAALALGDALFFTFAWEAGTRWQGPGYVWLVLSLNIMAALISATLLFLSLRRPNNPSLLLSAHASILLWLSWIAFPWLGELI